LVGDIEPADKSTAPYGYGMPMMKSLITNVARNYVLISTAESFGGDMVTLINSVQQIMTALQTAETENENCILVMKVVLAFAFRAPHCAHARRISFLR
jgi:hypothetical protein